MNEPFIFYRALDSHKGSWDGYGHFFTVQNDFLAYVTDAPAGASIQTPELIKTFWTEYWRDHLSNPVASELGRIELADGINRLQDFLLKRGRQDGSSYQATLSIARKLGSTLFYCSIGDSVIQLFRTGKLYRLTDSDVWDGSLILDEKQALKERRKTQTLRFVGNGGEFIDLSQVLALDLKENDLLLFNTDGMEDLLSPDRLIPFLKTSRDDLRKELERIFSQEKLKDDVTFLSLSVHVPPAFDSEKETAVLQSQVENLRKDQARVREDLARISAPQARLEKMEKNLQQIAGDVQALSKKIDSIKTGRPGLIATSRQPRLPVWLLLAVTFLLGATAGLAFLFLQTRPVEKMTPPVVITPKQPQKKALSPPEIPPSAECTYLVKKGDSLGKIATDKQMTLDQLLQWNPSLKKDSALKVGQEISVCGDNP